jgi:hypothetical protein
MNLLTSVAFFVYYMYIFQLSRLQCILYVICLSISYYSLVKLHTNTTQIEIQCFVQNHACKHVFVVTFGYYVSPSNEGIHIVLV